VLQDKNKYQARLKAALKNDSAPSGDALSTTTESSTAATLDDIGQDAKQPLSRRSSARSARSVRPPRSPQPGAQLDALQASLEEEIGKSTDDSDSPANSSQTARTTPPTLKLDLPAQRPSSSKGRRPSPLNLTPNPARSNEGMPKSAFLAPRSGSPDFRGGRRSPMREPPPSAPPFQTSTSINNLSASNNLTPMSSPPPPRNPMPRSPGLPRSPRPVTPNFQSIFSSSGKVIFDEGERRSQDDGPLTQEDNASSTPQTSKPPTDNEYLSDSSSSPTTPAPTSPRDALVESARKSPLVPRRSRMPGHRSSASRGSTSSSNQTINGPIVTRPGRSMSETKDTRMLSEQSIAIERRKSRSFEDLHSFMNAEGMPVTDGPLTSNSLLKGIGLDEAIEEMQRESEKYQQDENKDSDVSPIEPPKRAPPAIPLPQPSPLQPRSRSSTMSKSHTINAMSISPNEIPSLVLSVLSVRSRHVTLLKGESEDTLFTIRCRMKTGERSEVLRVEKAFGSIMDLGENLAYIPGMETFLHTFFEAFPSEKPDQRKVIPSSSRADSRPLTTFLRSFSDHTWMTMLCVRSLNSSAPISFRNMILRFQIKSRVEGIPPLASRR
jgi:hypothetical protein